MNHYNPGAALSAHERDLCMETLQLAGQLIMEYGGETFRVEETITRMGRAFGLTEVESFAVPSGIFISYRQADGEGQSSVKRVRLKGTDLSRVDEVNRISRHVEAGEMTLAMAHTALKRLRDEQVSSRLSPLAWGLCAGGFAMMFGGNLPEVAVSFLLCALARLLTLLLDRFHWQEMISTLLSAFICTLPPMLALQWFPALKTEATVAGALMPMLSGLVMTGAVQDTLRGDMVSGLTHGVRALLTAALVAGGALLAAAAVKPAAAGAELNLLELSWWAAALSSFAGTLGFALICRAPLRACVPASLVGTAAYLAFWALGRLGLSEIASVFCGTLLGTLLGMVCAREMRMIGTIFLMMSIVSFVPGLGLYRGMRFFGDGLTRLGAEQIIYAMGIIAMIVLGQAVGSFLFRAVFRHPHPSEPSAR